MTLATERRDGALLLTIDRPEAGNSLNSAVGGLLAEALRDVADSDDIRSVVLTGAGDRIFSAGMDLRAFASGEDMQPVGRGLQLLADCPKPVIAAVNGTAVAGGFEVVMRCDLVVAAEHARFGLPEVKRGLVAAGGGTRLPRRIPLPVALELGLTGEMISADRARELGLVNRVVPAADVLDEALALAALVNANGPLAVQATKRLMLEELGPDTADRVRATTRHVFDSEDAREGSLAFVEKRPPVWRGC